MKKIVTAVTAALAVSPRAAIVASAATAIRSIVREKKEAD
jgi:hypothetical protein